MGKYDGPSFLKRNQATKTNKTSEQEQQLTEKNLSASKKQASNRDLASNNKLLNESRVTKQALLEQQTSYQPSFRATEIPSPMFGFSQQHREPVDKAEQKKASELEWNYQRLKAHMAQKIKDKEFIMTEECLTPRIIARWKEHTPSIQQSSQPKKSRSTSSKLSTHKSNQPLSGPRKKKH